VPIGQRLLTDERRNALVQARALQAVAEADQNAAVNKLLLDAAKTYARWYEATGAAASPARACRSPSSACARCARARRAARRRPIDTVEALLEVQRRQVQRYEAEQATTRALDVATFLWAPRERRRPTRARWSSPSARCPRVRGLEAEPVDSAAAAAVAGARARGTRRAQVARASTRRRRSGCS
jgi:hypothetical protein